MKSVILGFTLLGLAASTVCAEPPVKENEKRCSTAIAEMLKTMKSTPLVTQRDKDDVKKLIDRIESMLSKNRANGVSECQSWGEFSKIVANY